jgi:vacuolar-type H+-ATPase subunit H
MLKIRSPFLHREFLLQALHGIGCPYSLGENIIRTQCADISGPQLFMLIGNKYYFLHKNHADLINYNKEKEKVAAEFLSKLEKEYKRLIAAARKTERETVKRLEREYVQQQKENVIAKAKEKGYSVREEKYGNNVKLVLVRTSY